MKYLEARKLAKPEEKKASGPANKMREVTENKDEWTLTMTPDNYIALNAESANPAVQARVALARKIVEARG